MAQYYAFDELDQHSDKDLLTYHLPLTSGFYPGLPRNGAARPASGNMWFLSLSCALALLTVTTFITGNPRSLAAVILVSVCYCLSEASVVELLIFWALLSITLYCYLLVLAPRRAALNHTFQAMMRNPGIVSIEVHQWLQQHHPQAAVRPYRNRLDPVHLYCAC